MRCLLHNVGVSTLVSAQRTRRAPGLGFPSTRPSPLQPSSARAGAVLYNSDLLRKALDKLRTPEHSDHWPLFSW